MSGKSYEFEAESYEVQSMGGFKGEPQDAPSGMNQKEKLELLSSEGVEFDRKGVLIDRFRLWNDFRV